MTTSGPSLLTSSAEDKIARNILKSIERTPYDISAYEDLFSLIRNEEKQDFSSVHALNGKLRVMAGEAVRHRMNVGGFFDLYKRTLLFDAPHFFDAYMLYLEINRKPEERFYQPRRRVLLPLVNAIQDLIDDNLDELFLSMPPRVGKTTTLMMLMTMLLGRNGNNANLYSAYSDVITRAFYGGILEIINDPITYTWSDIFPGHSIVQTNAADETINIDRRRRYPSVTCRSLSGTLNGACDCSNGGFLIADDLIGGIEEALNKDRLVTAWGKVDNNLIPRAKEQSKMLWCGTRWSVIDPAGVRMDLLRTDERFKNRRYRIVNLPALDANDESNFKYDYGVGFSTEYYHQRRASFERNNDLASWGAQYMCEPVEREGTLFTPADFRYYNGELPDGEPDRVFMAVDPAFGGGDFVASPVCYVYGEDVYVHDVVYDNGDKRVTQPLLAAAAERNKVTTMQIEANKATEAYKEGVEDELAKRGMKINITSKPAPNNKAKDQRIFDKAPDIRERMIFRESGKRDKPYSLFMQNVFSYKLFAKNKNDDAPDSLAMAISMLRPDYVPVGVFKRFI